MTFTERWIWLPKETYPKYQTTCFACGGDPEIYNYSVSEFKKKYVFPKRIKKAVARFCADTSFRVYCNGELLATGPVSVGGDFLENHRSRDVWYASFAQIEPCGNELDFYAEVKLQPVELCEFSKGKGGFMLTCHVEFEDGTKRVIHTDESWLCRRNARYVSPKVYDATVALDDFVNAVNTDNIWFPKDSPIPNRTETTIDASVNEIELLPHESKNETFDLDKIYSGFVKVCCKAEGKVKVKVECTETGESGSFEDITFDSDGEYRSFELHSAGSLRVSLQNESQHKATVKVGFVFTHYPVDVEAKTVTSDKDLNKILDVCRHTLKICRQTHHLDSPRHSEPLACTGDYYIETLMTLFSFGDMRLSKLDVLRTAELLVKNDGRMFHTTYSLIWVQMLYDVYMFTGDKKMLSECEEALIMLLSRFETYIGKNGIIENPPDYMFVDWIFIDGFSMHHPPKELGQSCLNMFYHGALDYASKIFSHLSDTAMEKDCICRRDALCENINKHLFDAEKEIYFEGMTDEGKDRYYLVHSNILACCYGVAKGDVAKSILEKVMNDNWRTSFQPYFAHFLFEALYKNDLSDKFALKLLERWKEPVRECEKGLVEGFISPDENYSFDHSHAWGGTPLYSLPKALTGFEVLEPGMKKVRVSPKLLGLESANVEIPTMYGTICVKQNKDTPLSVTSLDEITVVLE